MELRTTKIKDCFILEPKVFKDSRGYFMESFNAQTFKEKTGLKVDFVQDNESESTYGVIRGLHAQQGEYAQAKLVRVLKGEVLDVVVDIRPDSETYLKHITVKLSAENKQQLFVPRGCLHGFSVLSENATFFYKCDNYYNKESELGIRYDDPDFNIDWKVSKEHALVSEKDLLLPFYKDLNK
ncbi:dTDP-4-dehydrorhamnose 3,5-epimerase [Bizionia paragorgiae]|uniref:dTDP-4-dehydrorhamnose 3,5-epimerase n=1 Tax=Bizionia paragorgiae TaxID=283786 RepID=UPI003A94A7FD